MGKKITDFSFKCVVAMKAKTLGLRRHKQKNELLEEEKNKSGMFRTGKQTQTHEYASASLGSMSNTSHIHLCMLHWPKACA